VPYLGSTGVLVFLPRRGCVGREVPAISSPALFRYCGVSEGAILSRSSVAARPLAAFGRSRTLRLLGMRSPPDRRAASDQQSTDSAVPKRAENQMAFERRRLRTSPPRHRPTCSTRDVGATTLEALTRKLNEWGVRSTRGSRWHVSLACRHLLTDANS
jgi:hypothetical protein